MSKQHPSDRFLSRRLEPRAWRGGVALVAIVIGSLGAALADEPRGAASAPEIAVGDPVTLPFATQDQAAGSRFGDPPADREPQGGPRTAPRSGWLGLVVAESNVPGRWRIDEVATGGPADLAGIRVGDELRAVNGAEPRNADEIAQAITAITAGQTVLLAIGRESGVVDVAVRATVRPEPPGSRFRAASEAPAEISPPAVDPPSQPTPLAPTVNPPAPPTPLPPSVDLPAAGAAAPLPPAVDLPAAASLPPAASLPSVLPATPTLPRGPETFVAPPTDAVSRSRSPAFNPGAASALPPPSLVPSASGGRQVLGVRTIPIDPVIQARFQLSQPAGAYVVGLVHDLPAARAGVPLGSVIVALDSQPVRSPTMLTSLVSGSPAGRPVTLRLVMPDGTSRDAEVLLQAIDPPLLSVLGGGDPAAAPERQVARRPIEDSVTALEREVGTLRESLHRLEQRLEQFSPRR